MPSFEAIQSEIAEMLDVPDSELTEEQRAAMDTYLDELGSQEADKADAFAQFIKIQSARVEACKDEARRLAQKANNAQSRITWLKSKYLYTMLKHGVKKIQGNAYSLSARKTEAVQVNDSDANLEALKAINPDMVKTTISMAPVKAAIKEALKSGAELPGCFIVEDMSLQIR